MPGWFFKLINFILESNMTLWGFLSVLVVSIAFLVVAGMVIYLALKLNKPRKDVQPFRIKLWPLDLQVGVLPPPSPGGK